MSFFCCSVGTWIAVTNGRVASPCRSRHQAWATTFTSMFLVYSREIFRTVFPVLVNAYSNDFSVEVKSIVSNFAKILAWEFSASSSSLVDKFRNLTTPLWLIIKTPHYPSDSVAFPCLCDGGAVRMGPSASWVHGIAIWSRGIKATWFLSFSGYHNLNSFFPANNQLISTSTLWQFQRHLNHSTESHQGFRAIWLIWSLDNFFHQQQSLLLATWPWVSSLTLSWTSVLSSSHWAKVTFCVLPGGSEHPDLVIHKKALGNWKALYNTLMAYIFLVGGKSRHSGLHAGPESWPWTLVLSYIQ